MTSFLAACLAALVIAVGASALLSDLQKPVETEEVLAVVKQRYATVC